MKKVVLIDGNNLLFRSYYATAYSGNVMRSSKGVPTNAVLGFINMLNKIILEEEPKYLLIAFDKGKTFRHEKFLKYKAGRSETPKELKEQFPIIKDVLNKMGIKYLEVDNYEADDIIGTYAKQADINDDFIATIISSDKDLLQLISKDVEVKLLKSNDFIRMDRNTFYETYQIEPIRIIDLKSLEGDPSDNIPGVKGIGEKTALTLLKEYETLDNIYLNIENIKGSVKEKLIKDKEAAYDSYYLATIYKDIPLPLELEELKYEVNNSLEYIKLLNELELYSIVKRMDIKEEMPKTNDILYEKLDILPKIDEEFAFLINTDNCNYHKCEIIGISIATKDKNYYVKTKDLNKLGELLNNPYKKYTYDLKKTLTLLKYQNIIVNDNKLIDDLMIASYILNYNIKDDISYLANNFGYDIAFDETSKTKTKDESSVILNDIKKVNFIFLENNNFINKLKEEDVYNLYVNIDLPLTYVLADMEYQGINVDSNFLNIMGIEITKRIDELNKEIIALAGVDFNISSPKQLGDILFTKLAIPYPKKIKDNNYSTSKDILDALEGTHPIIDKILEYRTLSKLMSTYINGLLKDIKEDKKIHTTYTQTLTKTGRLSSIEPNLQNIPVRLEYGRLIRKAFISDADSVLMSADYSQVELRIFAHMSNATNFISAFNNNIDIHTKTASDIFHVNIEDVTSSMRRSAKAVNFGIIYGISSFGLSEDLKINVKDAKNFIDDYLNTYPGIKKYMDEVIEEAKKVGYVKTIMNRKRVIEELNNKNFMIRKMGERMALNTPIQGSSADILKKAMIEIYEEFNKLNLKSKMLLQVHDELIFNVYNSELETVKKIVKDIMENTYKLSIPLIVDISTGLTWYDAK
ncbi:MAG: DNA polymerase I [Bacilli bacterium]